MKRWCLFSLGLLIFFKVSAQQVSLNQVEQRALVKLIENDPRVKKSWLPILQVANESLNARPNPADTILTEGILQGNPRKTKTWKSLEDMPKVYSLSLAYVVTGNRQYLRKASLFFNAWAKGNTPTGNPINDTNLDPIIFAYDLLKSHLPKADHELMGNWLRKVASEEIRTYNKVLNTRSKTYFNNWHSHRIKIVAGVAWALADESLKNWVIDAYKRQIALNLMPDGSSHDFHERDALHYHIYDVDPLLVGATILNRGAEDGADKTVDYYSYQSATGSSLRKSVNWLVPFFTGEKAHAEWVNSKSAFDKKRAANGEKGYIAGTLFKPSEARTSIALAAYFEPQFLELYQQQVKRDDKYPTWQFVLNEIRRNKQ